MIPDYHRPTRPDGMPVDVKDGEYVPDPLITGGLAPGVEGVSGPSLPYGNPPTSGHSGTDTSRERAETEAADGTTGSRQRFALDYLMRRRERGATWKEFAEAYRYHHGQASATLSNLHKAGRVVRLAEKRDRCKVYVLPDYEAGRKTERFVPNKGRYPQRGDEVEAWIKEWRDASHNQAWNVVDDMLDEYRLAADTGRRLSEMDES